MHRFLFTTLPSNDLGLLARSLPIARELSARGHEIAFSSPAKAPRMLIAEAGYQNLLPRHPLYHVGLEDLSLKGLMRILRSRPLKDEYGSMISFAYQLLRAAPIRFAPSTPEIWNMDHAAAVAGMMNTNFVRAHCGALMDLIADFDPDAIVDFWNPFACIAARALGKPLVTVIQADAHPNSKGFIWWKDPPDNVPSALPALNKVLAGYGLRSLSKMEELSLGDLTLIVGTPETDPLPDSRGGVYIGPILWQNPDAEAPGWLEQLEDGRPIIWVYSGNPRYAPRRTAVDSEVVLDATIEALAEQEVNVVLTTGYHELPEAFLPLPDNFHFAQYVPGLTMAQKCDLMVHHGGYGSCQTGLYTGTPAVIIPTYSERESNARRIAALGAGEFVLPKTDRSGRKWIVLGEFQTKVMQVLSTPTYVEHAVRCSEILRSYGGAKEAARLIEDFVMGSAGES